MTVDWESWHAHVDHVVATQGCWYGIGDGNGAPLFTLPAPLEGASADQWGQVEDIEVTFPGRDADGRPSRVAELLVTGGLGGVDESGRVSVAEGDYMILAAFPGDGGVVRRGGAIVHTKATDPSNSGVPDTVTINALSVGDVWNTIPAVSWPAAWWKARPYERTEDESGIEYDTPRLMAGVQMTAETMFTWKHGRAVFVIGRLAQESLDAVMMSQADPDGTRWVDDAYHVVEMPEVDKSPEISLEARDGFLWETVIGQAKNAGVVLGARLWWPGDAPVRCWTPAHSGMDPVEVDISPSEGEPTRVLDDRVFPHAMIVLEVKHA